MKYFALKRVGLAAALIAAIGLTIGGCSVTKPTAPVADTGSLDFTSMVVIGNSLSAGFSSGGLGLPSQEKSWPMQLATAIGYSDFQQPTISAPGIPAQKKVVVVGTTPTIGDKSGTGVPQNTTLGRAYNNLAVPGANTVDMLTDDGSTVATIGQVILRGQGTQLQQAANLDPTVLFCWIGANDVLGGAVYGQIVDGTTTVPTSVTQTSLAAIFGYLTANTTADLVVMNVPDVTVIPYVSFATKGKMSPLTDAAGTQVLFPVITTGTGAIRVATAGDYILLPALSAMGADPTLGTSGANPLPDNLVVDSAEVTDLQGRVTTINNAIASQVTSFNSSASPRTATLIDMYTFFNTVASSLSYTVGSTTYPLYFEEESGLGFGLNAAFAFDSGMAMGLDGVHPSPVGYTLVANYIAARLNDSKGANIPMISYTSALYHPKQVAPKKIALKDMPDFSGVAERMKALFKINR